MVTSIQRRFTRKSGTSYFVFLDALDQLTPNEINHIVHDAVQAVRDRCYSETVEGEHIKVFIASQGLLEVQDAVWRCNFFNKVFFNHIVSRKVNVLPI